MALGPTDRYLERMGLLLGLAAAIVTVAAMLALIAALAVKVTRNRCAAAPWLPACERCKAGRLQAPGVCPVNTRALKG
jgi:hypothetical protein